MTQIIDFHTHVYPDAIASRTLCALSKAAGVDPVVDGTIGGLLDCMRDAGVDKSVILPVNTRKGQFDTITRFAQQINDTYENLIYFGGIHPDDDAPEEKLLYLREHGFKGVKIHPDYTETFIDDERYIRIIAECARLGLLVLSHAGKDPAYDIIHCPAQKGKAMLDRVRSLTGRSDAFFIFAHLGGYSILKDVEKYLVGQNCYIDISCSFRSIGPIGMYADEEVIRLINSHGADKILFATDSPWNGQKEYIEHIRKLDGLSDTEKDMILGGNAERLLSR